MPVISEEASKCFACRIWWNNPFSCNSLGQRGVCFISKAVRLTCPFREQKTSHNGIPMKQIYKNIIVVQCIVDILSSYHDWDSQEAYQHLHDSYEIGQVFQGTGASQIRDDDLRKTLGDLLDFVTELKQAELEQAKQAEQTKKIKPRVTLHVTEKPRSVVPDATTSPPKEKRKKTALATASVNTDFPSVSDLTSRFFVPLHYVFEQPKFAKPRSSKKKQVAAEVTVLVFLYRFPNVIY